MADLKIHLQVITPKEVKINQDADMVIMRSTSGDMGILPGHKLCTTALDDGVLRIVEDKEERRLAVYGGFAEVQDDVITIVTNDAEWPEEIDRIRAESDREHAEQRLNERINDVEIRNAQVLLRRSLVRIEVSSYPFISKVDTKE